MSTAATTETKPAPAAIEKIMVKVDGREIEVPRLMADWSGKLVPTTMIDFFGLQRSGSVVVAGNGTHLEIWSPEAYDRFVIRGEAA